MAKLKVVNESGKTPDTVEAADKAVSITKPSGFDLNKFKSKRGAVMANVGTMQGALPHYSIAGARDFVRLHADEKAYWSDELCFVSVPIVGQKGNLLHLIDEDLALQFLESGKIIRHRLALASKPNDVFFLAHIPSQNLDNSWNLSATNAAEQAKKIWVQLTSRKAEGVESYKVTYARDADAFQDPKWPKLSLEELIETAFIDRIIITPNHPALLRLIGAKQEVS
jgi:hypothetical protein